MVFTKAKSIITWADGGKMYNVIFPYKLKMTIVQIMFHYDFHKITESIDDFSYCIIFYITI